MTNRPLLNLYYAEATLDLMLMLDVCLRETSRITKDLIHLFQTQSLGFGYLQIIIRDPIVPLFSWITDKKCNKEATKKGEHLLREVSPEA